ncbi:hypothetical protein BDN70DRAFT_884494 [Pholiota conissans]|uniref:Uncharacterized protein n=1 Tax=Pholiota conissans TaxID=109636 RepID=A0A9P5YVN7_9AGAR|nr:hypothetical protein BDN70DRAFT_884494 [Pholiota conissans]
MALLISKVPIFALLLTAKIMCPLGILFCDGGHARRLRTLYINSRTLLTALIPVETSS